MTIKIRNFFKTHWEFLITLLVLSLLAVFSFKLMFLTFNYDASRNYMHTATKVWADFSCHIPLIRSFSLGGNLTRLLRGELPEYPLYSGEEIKYHFLFYMFVGLLERSGLRIDWALNIPSIVGFFLLSSMVFLLSKKIFKDIWVGILSLVFFFFNGSFAFISFFQANPISKDTIKDIFTNKNFWGLAPWAEGTIASALWNLNVFTNQRHFAGALGLVLLFVFTSLLVEGALWKKQKIYGLVWGLLFGMLPFLHQPVFLIFSITLAWYWLVFPRLRRCLTITGVVGVLLTLPQVLGISHGSSLINWHFGYIVRPPLTAHNIISFWWQNIGFHVLLIPFGFLISPSTTKKYFFPVFIVFAMAFLITFSPDPATNHKFFNFYMIMGGMLSSFVLIQFIKAVLFESKKVVIKIFGITLFASVVLMMTLSGIIDLFAILNDDISYFPDIEAHPVTTWVAKNTKPEDYILNSSYFTPVTYAGRSIYLGYLYATWSAGYDNATRQRDHKIMLESTSVKEQYTLFHKYSLDYIVLEEPPQERGEFIPNYAHFASQSTPAFTAVYNGTTYTVYDVKPYCSGV